jgi:FKBP-type peptidyl-prolyl cis-trans isomerase
MMKNIKRTLWIAGMLCCSSFTLKAQDDLADKITKDREQLKNERHFSGVKETLSGLLYQVYNMGTGSKPKPNSIVKLKYKLMNFDGAAVEDHSDDPWVGRMDNTISGFQEALKMMPAGSKLMVWMPARLCINKKGKVGGGRALFAYLQLLAVK